MWKLLQNVIVSVPSITNYDKKLLKSVTGVTKCENYYKIGRNNSMFKFM